MKKSKTTILAALSVAVALAGVAFGTWSSAQRKAAEAETARLRQQLAQVETARALPDPGAATPQAGSTNDLAGLQALLAERDAQLAALKRAPEPGNRENRPSRESFEERLARMKAEDPEGYAERMKQQQEFQQRMQYNFAERTATFMDLDTSTMTEEERKNHELLVDKMASIWELTAQFQDPEQGGNREVMGQLFNQIRETRPLLEQERSIMFKQLGSAMGYAGDDAQDFAEHIQKIIESTSVPIPGFGGRPSGGGPGGGPGGGSGGRGGRGDGGGSPAN